MIKQKQIEVLRCKKCGIYITTPYADQYIEYWMCGACGGQGFERVCTQKIVPLKVEEVRMKITKKQWEEIEDYIFAHDQEIWDLAVSHTSNIHDATVWLDGISDGRYKLWVGRYTTGTDENPKNSDSLLVYRLSRNWKDTIFNTEEGEEYEDEEYYEVGYKDFLEELHDDWFWEELKYNNGLEIIE